MVKRAKERKAGEEVEGKRDGGEGGREKERSERTANGERIEREREERGGGGRR